MKRVSQSNEGPEVGAAREKFDSSDSNGRFCQMKNFSCLQKLKQKLTLYIIST